MEVTTPAAHLLQALAAAQVCFGLIAAQSRTTMNGRLTSTYRMFISASQGDLRTNPPANSELPYIKKMGKILKNWEPSFIVAENNLTD